MLDFLRSWIVNIVTISIILILFEIIIPTGKIKKIINLVSGFILLIAVINPFLALRNQDLKLNDKMLADSYYIDKKEIEAGSRILEQKQIKQISDLYKKKLATSIQEEIGKIDGIAESNVDVAINEDYGSEKFGEVNKVYVELVQGKKQDRDTKINSVAAVKKVDIEVPFKKNNSRSEANKATDSDTEKLTELVKKNLVRFFEIKEENVVVKIAG